MKKTEALRMLKPGVVVRVKKTGELVALGDPAIKVSKDFNSILVLPKYCSCLRHTEIELALGQKPDTTDEMVKALMSRPEALLVGGVETPRIARLPEESRVLLLDKSFR
jgi:hypothetical protein